MGIKQIMSSKKYKEVTKIIKRNPGPLVGWADDHVVLFKVYCTKRKVVPLPDMLKATFIRKAKELNIEIK